MSFSNKRLKHIFVTVGTTQFDQLIDEFLTSQTITTLRKIGCTKLTIQYGNYKNYNNLNLFQIIHGIRVELFSFVTSIKSYIDQCDLVIAHAGAGTALEVLRQSKPLIIVINENLMDNHQEELGKELDENGFAVCTYISDLANTLSTFDVDAIHSFPRKKPEIFCEFVHKLFIKSN